MSTTARILLAGGATLALGLSFYLAGHTRAGEEGGAREGILKIAKALEKGDDATAKSEAKALAKKIEEIDEVMDLMKPRAKKGLGVGSKKGAIIPDGIEQKLNTIARDAPGQATVEKEAAALQEMAYRIAAIAEVTGHKVPKDAGSKKQLWTKWANDLRKAAPALAKAAQEKSPASIQKAAAKINSSCNSCHSEFR